jgi:glutathione S-transferase
MTAPTIKLTYFDIEGAAEPTRLALVLTGTAFEDDRVNFGAWGALKPTTPYGGLPVMAVDGAVHTESGAMLRWVGATFSKPDKQLYPSDKMFELEETVRLLIAGYCSLLIVMIRMCRIVRSER